MIGLFDNLFDQVVLVVEPDGPRGVQGGRVRLPLTSSIQSALMISSRLSSGNGSRHFDRVLVRPQPVRGTRASHRVVPELVMLARFFVEKLLDHRPDPRSSDRAPAVITQDPTRCMLEDLFNLFVGIIDQDAMIIE